MGRQALQTEAILCTWDTFSLGAHEGEYGHVVEPVQFQAFRSVFLKGSSVEDEVTVLLMETSWKHSCGLL